MAKRGGDRARHIGQAAVLALALMLAPAAASALLDWEAGELSASLDGSARSFQFFELWPDYGDLAGRREALTLSRLRAEGRLRIGGDLSVELAYDLTAIISDNYVLIADTGSEELALQSASPLRIEDLHAVISRGENYRLLQNLDRAALDWSLPFAELKLGRQAITLGSALLLSPLDIFAPFPPASLDTEYKRGVDALRLTLPLGLRHEAELIAVGNGDEIAEGVFLARWHSMLEPMEIALSAGASYREPSFGLELAGEIGGTGWYAEALFRRGRERDDLLRATCGLQRQFNPTWSGFAELHYSGVGEEKPADYWAVMSRPEWEHGETFLLGRYYAALNLSWQARPLLALQLLGLGNLEDGSTLLEPVLAWDFGENTAVGLGAVLGLGETPEPSAPYGWPEIRSEFGLLPDTYFAEIRVYF